MKKVFKFLIILFFGLCLPIFTFADVTEENPLLPDFLMPGVVEGTGTHFEVSDSRYLNIVLESSAAITLRLESVPEMVTMHIGSAPEATSSQITIKGFEPSTTYYKYEDDYHNEVAFTTDGNGSYSWTQDLSQPHLVFIQPRKSTKFIRDDVTGGDCYLIGIWDSATKTCTLTTDVYETIQIDSNYITLDGNGHTVTGTGTGYGVYLPSRIGVTIKNLSVKNFYFGIYLYSSSNNTLTGNTASNNPMGIYLYSSSNNTLTGNTVSNNYYGIYLSSSDNNTLTRNTTGYNSSYGIHIWYSNNNTLMSNTVSNNSYGIALWYSSNNNLTGNTVSNNYHGISLWYSSNNTLTGGTASNSNSYGIYLYASSNNNLTGNTASNNYYGIYLYASSNNQIYNNNFINNGRQAYVYGSGNIFDLDVPIGGNYWSDFDTPAEGCYDANYDGFCDAPHYFYGGVDYLPWAKQSGWEVPADTTPPTTTATISGILGDNGWYVSDVQITLTATDNEGGSGVKEIHYILDGVETIVSGSTANVPISTDGAHNPNYWAVDNAGNVEQAKPVEIKIDKTPPTITATASPTPNANGWNNTDVTVSFTCSDFTSGIASCPSPITVTTEGAGQVISGTAIDKASNTTTASVALNIDKTPPVVNITVTPGFLWPPNHKMVDVTINGGATDTTSQIASIVFTVKDEYGKVEPVISGFNTTIPLEAWREGTDKDGRVYTITVVVTDKAGNQSTAITEVIVPHDMRK